MNECYISWDSNAKPSAAEMNELVMSMMNDTATRSSQQEELAACGAKRIVQNYLDKRSRVRVRVKVRARLRDLIPLSVFLRSGSPHLPTTAWNRQVLL